MVREIIVVLDALLLLFAAIERLAPSMVRAIVARSRVGRRAACELSALRAAIAAAATV
jgi:hypothetical protein